MKRIEAVVRRAALNSFYQCAEKLGIFGFDLSENRRKKATESRSPLKPENTAIAIAPSRLTVDFAVLDREAKDTVHAVLEQVHPDSIAIFDLEESAPSSEPSSSTDRKPV
jgi:hypothetical protein